MYIKFFKRFLCLFFLIVLLTSCDGKDCIEADDFGEYNTDILTIDAKDGLCNWEDNSDGGNGSETIAECLNTVRTTTVSTGGSCSVVLSNAACSSIKDCLIGISGVSCLNSFVLFGDGCSSVDDDTKRINLERAYSKCIEDCMSTCLIDSFMKESSFEPAWLSNSPKSDSGGYGIEISSSQIVNIQALGSITLFDVSDKSKTFQSAVNHKRVQSIPNDSSGTYFNTLKNIQPILTGKWCKAGDVGTCIAINQVGEFGTGEDIPARLEFLRRGVLMINNLPSGGSLNSYGGYTGPDQEINYDYWKCSYDENNAEVSCATDYPDTSYKSQHDFNYEMNNIFVKTLGGTVVPKNVSKFIWNNPFSDVSCTTNSSNQRECTKSGSSGNLVPSGVLEVNSLSILSGTPYFLGYDGGMRKIKISSSYPIKLAFAIIGGNSNDECMVNVLQTGTTTSNVFNVKANGKWFFAEDGTNSIALFNKSKYNTLKAISNSQNQDFTSNVFELSATTDSSQTWKDSSGNDIPCGEGMAVFIIPQNEILINKSGFVSFKNLLGNFVYCSGTIQECAGASTPTSYQVKFDIINPMYNFRSDVENTPLLEKNFYEYSNDGNSIPREISVQSGTAWSSDVFVRKGQILRFNENNWFNITGDSTNGYIINRKFIKYNNIYLSTAEGLALRIEARPALICSGTAIENIDNPLCIKIYDSQGNTVCQPRTFFELCSNSAANNYCPSGCYCQPVNPNTDTSCKAGTTVYVSGANESIQCMYIQGVTLNSCNQCSQTIASNPPIDTTIAADIVQCYDLENYVGAVVNLTNLANTSLYSSDVSKYGELTVNDYLFGARKLGSIFNGGEYGNLDAMTLDTSYKDATTGVYSEFRYNSPSELSTINKNISFFVIENSNFNVGFSGANDMYSNNAGQYQFIVSLGQYFNNGEQMGVALALKGWSGSESDPEFKKWVVKYNIDKSSTNYGSLDNENSPYHFDYNGYIVNRTTGASNISIADLNVTGVNIDDYKNLRLYFKIIDKQEEVACGTSTTKATYTQMECKCSSGTNSTNYTSCDTLTCDLGPNLIYNGDGTQCKCSFGKNSSSWMSCSTISCDEGPKILTRATPYCVNSYYNNNGTYSLKLRTPKDFLNTTGYIVKYVMKPILEVIDGKNIGLYVDNDGEIEACSSTNNSECNIYFPESLFDPAETTFGNKCKIGDSNCYRNCSTLATDLYKSNCKYFNNGGGFLQRFYVAVITDNAYQTIVKLCFTLMIMFYGMYYLMGMADLTHGELVKRIIKISFIYLMIGSDGWKYYNMFFVKFFKQGVDYIVFAVAGAFDQSASLTEAFVKGDFYDKSVLFSGVDKNLSLLFSDPVSCKIWGLFFVSFFGWLYVFIIYSSVLTYIFSVANALLLYLTAQFFLSLLLAFGPIFFVLLIFEKTKEMFNKWMNNLISFALEQVFLLTCLSLFNVLVYNIIKFILSYRVCWKPVWEINLPLLGNLQLMSFWKATTATSASAAASAIPGLFQILLIYLIADLMSKFIEFATDLGTSIGGAGVFLKTLSKDIKESGSKFYDKTVAKPIKDVAKDISQRTAKKLIGYKTAEEEKKEDVNSSVARKGLRTANLEADKALAQYKRLHAKELLGMSNSVRNEELAKVREDAFKSYYNNHKEVQAAAQMFGVRSVDDFLRVNDTDLQKSRSLLGLAGEKFRVRAAVGSVGAIGSSIMGSKDMRVGAFQSAEKTREKMERGETGDASYTFRAREKAAKHIFETSKQDLDAQKKADKKKLEEQYGGMLARWTTQRGTRSQYNDAVKEIEKLYKKQLKQLQQNVKVDRGNIGNMASTEQREESGRNLFKRLWRGNERAYRAAVKEAKKPQPPTTEGEKERPATTPPDTPAASSNATPTVVPSTASSSTVVSGVPPASSDAASGEPAASLPPSRTSSKVPSVESTDTPPAKDSAESSSNTPPVPENPAESSSSSNTPPAKDSAEPSSPST